MTHTDDPQHEAELRDLLERTMTGTTAPAEIGPHALMQGHRLRTRRRIGVAAGAVAASAAAALILPMALGGGSTTVIDPAGEPSSAASDPASDLAPVERPPGWWDMPATDMVSAVEAIAPDGVIVTAPGLLIADTEEGGPATGWINAFVTGPTGPGRLNVSLYPEPTTDSVTLTPDEGSEDGGDQVFAEDCDAPELADSNVSCNELAAPGTQVFPPGGTDVDISCPGNLAPRAQCSELFAADGTTVIGRRSSTSFGGRTTLEFVLRRNGGTVHAETTNSLDDKPGAGSPVSAERPPLTLDQLEALVRNDTWVKPAT